MFDQLGRFLRRIGEKGQGKGKYQSILDFCFSPDEQKIYILASDLPDTRYLEYEINGNIVTETTIDSVPTQILPLTNELFVFHCGNYPAVMASSVDQSLIITDLKSKWRYYQNYQKRYNNAKIAVLRSPFYLYQGNMRFMEFGVDTLYTVTEEKLIPYSIFLLGKKEIPHDVSIQELQTPKYSGHVWILDILEEKDNFYVKMVMRSNRLLYGFHNKSGNLSKVIGHQGFQNDIDGGLSFFPKYIFNDSILVDYVIANDLHEHVLNSNEAKMKKQYGKNYDDLVKLLNNIEDKSNPIVILVKKY